MKNLTNKKRTFILIAAMLGVFLASLDVTVVATSIMSIVKEFNGFNLYTWPFTAFMLTSTICMPLFGKLADKFGHKPIYVFGIAIFVIGSCLCGISQNMIQLILMRGLQGIGAAILTANSMSIVGAISEPNQRAKYLGIFGAAGALASIIGPSLGGYITDHFSWRWIFYINVPIGIFALIAIIIALPSKTGEQSSKKIDYFGAITLVVGLVPMLLALTWGGNKYAWDSALIIFMLVFSVVMLLAFIFIEKHASDPIVPLTLFKKADFNISSIEMFFIGAVMIGVFAFLPMYLQAVVGRTASQAGSLLTPVMVSTIVCSIVSGVLVSKVGRYKIQVIVGFIVLTLSTVLFANLGVDTKNSTVMLYMVIIGIGIGLTLPIFNTTAQNAFPENQLGVVTSAVQFFKSMGTTISSAVLGTILTTTLTNRLSTLNTYTLPGQVAGMLKNPKVLSNPSVLKDMANKLPSVMLPEFNKVLIQMKQMLCDSISLVFTICTVIAIIALIISLFIKEKPFTKKQEA